VLQAAGQDGSLSAHEALEALCRRYWPAIYSFLRRKGFGPDDAADLAQGYFAQLLENNAIARADRSKGRFRSFLLGGLQRFLTDELRHRGAQKRGHGKLVLALDFQAIEECYLEEADPGLTPEQHYDRCWAATVLEAALVDLENEFRKGGQEERFNRLRKFLSEDVGPGDFESIGAQLGIEPKAVSSAVSRLRARYREMVRANVLATVTGAAELDLELDELFQ
jgi:RNA polymerase sigma-70 factor (ECF subfamily)